MRAGDRPVRLTPSEFELLATLMAAPGHAFSRLELLERLQGVAIEGVEHTVNTHNFIASAETFYQRHGSWAGAGEFFRQLERPPEPGAPPRPPQFVLADQNGVVITPAQPYRAGDRVEDDRLARGAPVEVAGRRVGTVIDVARARRIALQVSVEPELPDVVVDPERMIQVLGNLVTNALRYTPPAGRIALSARLQGTAVALAVQDTGAGHRAGDPAAHLRSLLPWRPGAQPARRRVRAGACDREGPRRGPRWDHRSAERAWAWGDVHSAAAGWLTVPASDCHGVPPTC